MRGIWRNNETRNNVEKTGEREREREIEEKREKGRGYGVGGIMRVGRINMENGGV